MLSLLSITSVADPGRLSRIPDPDFCPSRIKKYQQKRGVKKKFVVLPFFLATKITKLKIMLVLKFELVKKKIWANLQRMIELSTQKSSLSSQKYGFGIRNPEKKPMPDPRSGSATLSITHLLFCCSGYSHKADSDPPLCPPRHGVNPLWPLCGRHCLRPV
jgi:hypothetical protein